ncbi:MAG: hypothetical protein FJZ59_06630 [Chlamydiae bacterium]|nr:hypothetical protein [Chlamydiota bacterium]
MTPLLSKKTPSEQLNELFSSQDYDGITKFLTLNREKISLKLRTRVLIDFLMLANVKSDSLYGAIDLKEAKLCYDYAVWIKRSGDTNDIQGSTNVAQMMKAISIRFPLAKESSKSVCCRCM